jgi:hypothetical protein
VTPLIVVEAFIAEIQPAPLPVIVKALALAEEPLLMVVLEGVAVAPGLTSLTML